jgi:hypothetical protein
MSTSTEITLVNGSRLVVDNGAEALRLIWERGATRDQAPERNCDLTPDDLVTLMSVLARDGRRRFGSDTAHRVELAVRGAIHAAEPRTSPRLTPGAPDTET